MNNDILTLPDPLITSAGRKVQSVRDWEAERRDEVLELFRQYVYGRTPLFAGRLDFEVFDHDNHALDGRAVRKQVKIKVAAGNRELCFDLLVYLPLDSQKHPVPVFSMMNFRGNHTTNSDPAITLTQSYINPKWMPAGEFRGARVSRLPLWDILERGYGLSTAYYGDIDPDFPDDFQNGVHPLLDPPDGRSTDAWGAIGAWAWGHSRIMDYFETDDQIDHTRVAVAGHSRLGKTALWAGAQDKRFAMVISNNSGCTGAAVSRGKRGENIKAINTNFPHWFCENYKQYNDRENELPVDQHMLLALIAPRPVYVASATRDLWADPASEFSACVHAGPVYRLYELKDLQTATMPVAEQPLHAGHIGYHLRDGKHDVTAYDWKCYMDFADKFIK